MAKAFLHLKNIMMLLPKSVEVNAPLILGQQAHRHFFSVRITAKHRESRFTTTHTGQDKDLLVLKDYGYYVAGVEAKKSYIQLMQHWRKHSSLPAYLLAKPKKCAIAVTGKLTDTSSFDCRSSQLALLLGMIACQQKLPFQYIYATGELDNREDLPKVEAVEGLEEKLNATLKHIEQNQPLVPILIALPKFIFPTKNEADTNLTKLRYARRIDSFIRQYSALKIRVIYCHDLVQDLEKLYLPISTYRHLTAKLNIVPLATVLAFFIWQYQQPLYLNWSNTQKDLRPLRISVQNSTNMEILPLCPQSKLGEAVFSIGDLLALNIKIDDFSWLASIISANTAVVLVGEKSGVRVENLPQKSNAQFATAFIIEPPQENYLVVAIAQKNISIDKGKLNKKLSQLIAGIQGIERLTTVSGYLEKHYNSLPYRFRVTAPNCEDKE